MLWIKAFHIIFMVTWFAGLFYLPRLFVYHAMTTDALGNARFKMMERKLFYGIMTPGAVLTLVSGGILLSYNFQGYMQAGWMHAKLFLVLLLVILHVYYGKLCSDFRHDRNRHSPIFYRWVNEIPSMILIGVVILVVVRPW